ncbi:hypothetical protein Clacol_005904 [Clathrus columnatus]|uniref:Uncharacterized protein n=1 Tax=Clathrus columnatus TaxID=1419009 RepID=A0AAV5AG70_9AGAM|nr:hypothetical protein Clacol_005904 [Clathrus columnatus]
MRQRRSGCVVIIGSRSAWTAKAAVRIAAQKLQSTPNTNIPSIHHNHPPSYHHQPIISSPPISISPAIAESLTEELKPFNIRVLLVQPGAFRTRMILNSTIKPANSLINPDYQKFHTIASKVLSGVHGKQPGDPRKAGRVIVDIVRGEGHAFGKMKWPDTIFLGDDAVKDVRKKCEAVLACLDDEEWCHVLKDVTF